MGNPPVLQTPLNEEINIKRDREGTTPSSRPVDQTFAKRKGLNPYSKEEYTKDTTGNIVTQEIDSL